MELKETISKAIAVHVDWKRKLDLAIETGQSESTPERVRKDYNCSFGKWLHHRIDPAAKDSPHYKDILELHADFHREAGHVLELALKGDKAAARELVASGSTFQKVSGELTRKMLIWKSEL